MPERQMREKAAYFLCFEEQARFCVLSVKGIKGNYFCLVPKGGDKLPFGTARGAHAYVLF